MQKKSIQTLILGLAIMAFSLSACVANEEEYRVMETPEDSNHEISVDQFESMMEEKDFTLINVRTPFEGNIPGTDLYIPYDEIDQHQDELPQEKDAMILLYCRSSRTSEIAVNTLVQMGYTNVWHLIGGYEAWIAKGHVLEQ